MGGWVGGWVGGWTYRMSIGVATQEKSKVLKLTPPPISFPSSPFLFLLLLAFFSFSSPFFLFFPPPPPPPPAGGRMISASISTEEA